MENILVSIRVRPLSKQETVKGSPWRLTPNTISVTSGSTYSFDKVFGPDSKTKDIYDAHTKKIISSAVQGFNGTIFAYGQTSSGKTFTMRGTEEEPGIIPLAIQDIFRNIAEAQNREFLLRMSYMEIYNEEIKDLLAPENCKLQIHENPERGVFVAGLREEIVDGLDKVLELLEFGEANRRVGETNMNVLSSRSHAIFRMVIESRDRSQDDPSDREQLQNSDPVRVSHLNLVDLAGSERVAKTGAEGTRLKEGSHINKSLMTLGNVINKLSEGIEKQGGHVPYRDSKLTRILQPALGGNARTVIICNITPALVHIDESRGTLQFASRANRVTNCAQVNEIVTDAALLKRQKKEIAELRQKLQEQEKPSGQFEAEILNLRSKLLGIELERERMALELQEFQKSHAERERCIKEQEQKIANLSTMVINSAVDNRQLMKRKKRSNRRETWCARPQSRPPFENNFGTPDNSTPEAAVVPDLALKINRERSFGLPPPFEELKEEDEDQTGGSLLDEDFESDFNPDSTFSIPDCGPQSYVAERRRRSSSGWVVATEFEQQLLDLQGRYDTLQLENNTLQGRFDRLQSEHNDLKCLHEKLELEQNTLQGCYDSLFAECNTKTNELNAKDTEVEKLKRIVREQTTKSKIHSKDPGSGKRGKSLDGWSKDQSIEMIKLLRQKTESMEAEKTHLQNEHQKLSDQVQEQQAISAKEVKEVREEHSSAKAAIAKLNLQLKQTLVEVEQLQLEKQNADAHCVEELEAEVDGVQKVSSALETFVADERQLLTSTYQALQDVHEYVRDLSNSLDVSALRSQLGTVRTPADSIEPNAVEFKEKRDRRTSDIRNPVAGSQEAEPTDCDIKPCDSVASASVLDAASSNYSELKQENDTLHAAIISLHAQIVQITSEKHTLLQTKADLETALDHHRSVEPKDCDMTHDAASGPGPNADYGSFNESKDKCNALQAEVHSLDGQMEQIKSERQAWLQAKAQLDAELERLRAAEPMDCITEQSDFVTSASVLDAAYRNDNEWKEENTALQAAVEGLRAEIDHVKSEKLTLLQTKADLEAEVQNLKSVESVVCVMQSDDSIKSASLLDTLSGSNSELNERNDVLNEVVESLQGQIEQMTKETSTLLQTNAGLEAESEKLRSHVQVQEEEKEQITKENTTLLQTNADLEAGMKKLRSHVQTQEEEKGVVGQVERQLQEQTNLTGKLENDVQRLNKENERLLLSETSYLEEIFSLKAAMEAVENDMNVRMGVNEERVAEIEKQKLELDETVKALHLTKKDHDYAQQMILELKSSLSRMQDERITLETKLKAAVEEKEALSGAYVETDSQLQEFKARSGEAIEELEIWQQRYQDEVTQHRAEMISLRKEISTLKAAPTNLSKEKDGLQRDLEKTKTKLKDLEAKLKTAIQDKNKLETEKLNTDRELKQLRQSTSLQRDINKRESIADQRRQSIALGVSKTKHQLSSAEHALQVKAEEVEQLTHELHAANESYAKLEFAMTEAESDSKERIAKLEEGMSALEAEKSAALTNIQQLEKDLEALKLENGSKTKEIETIQAELVTLKEKLKGHEDERKAIEEELFDSHLTFQSEKNKLASEAQESKEKCNSLNQAIVMLTEESQKLKKLQSEAADSKRLLEDELRQALEKGSQKSLAQHQHIMKIEADVESNKARCRSLELELESAEKRELELRMSASVQLEKLRIELQQTVAQLSEARDAEMAFSTENESLLISNTKLQVGLDATRDKLEIFETRLDDSNWELTEFKRLLQKAGLTGGDEWNLVSLQQFETYIKSQTSKARKMEAELASKKMEMIDLEVQVEAIRSQCEKYQDEIAYLKRRVLTPEQEAGARELVRQNKDLKTRLDSAEEEVTKLRDQQYAREGSLTKLQASFSSLQAQNLRLRKDLAASKAEVDALRIGQKSSASSIRENAFGKYSASKSLSQDKILPLRATSQSIFEPPPSGLESSYLRAEKTAPAFMQSGKPASRSPLSEIFTQGSPSPVQSQRKRPLLFPATERTKLSRSLGLSQRYFPAPSAQARQTRDQENFNPQ